MSPAPTRSCGVVSALGVRDRLASHGSDPVIVQQSFITRALYDIMFRYGEGALNRPSYAAGMGEVWWRHQMITKQRQAFRPC